MRDPKRITGFINTLLEAWQLYPDLRLTQLLHAAGGSFYTEDVDVYLNLLKLIENKEKMIKSPILPPCFFGCKSYETRCTQCNRLINTATFPDTPS